MNDQPNNETSDNPVNNNDEREVQQFGDNALNRRWHRGVYAAIIEDGNILAVKKARGPYKGQLDLPGGAPDLGESLDQTLTREIEEETNGSIVVKGDWLSFDLLVNKDSDGNPIWFRHYGDWCLATVSGINFEIAPREDVEGLTWIDIKTDINDPSLSKPLSHIIAQLSELNVGNDQ